MHCTVESPWGRWTLEGDAAGLRRIVLAPEAPPRAPGEELAEAHRQLTEYFAGARRSFTLRLAPDGTPFQHEVWALLRAIPYGETRSYGELAQALGKPGAARAVGSANGRNPLPIVVPCHRVIQTGGKLGGYAFGLDCKRGLLALERETVVG